ncbi:MAG TPA: hypothetical protein V6C72_00580, partial [Chroococcales cyanobacterium]
DGTRRVVSIAEITGVHDGVVSMQELFEYRQDGIGEDKKVIGVHRATGIRPYHESKFREASLDLRVELFTPDEQESETDDDGQTEQR